MRRGRLLALPLLLVVGQCCGEDESRPVAAPGALAEPFAARAAAGEPQREYTVRVVFKGLVGLALQGPENAPPTALWALVADAHRPADLPVHSAPGGEAIVPHEARLWYRGNRLDGVRPDGSGERPCSPLPLPPAMDFMNLSGVQLELQADWKTSGLHVVRGRRVLPAPCDPGPDCSSTFTRAEQARDFDWVIDAQEVAKRAGLRDDSFRAGLVEDQCTDCGFLAARLKLERGEVFTRRLYNSEFRAGLGHFEFPPANLPRSALAETVALEARVAGPLVISATPLREGGAAFAPIKLEPRDGEEEVEIWLDSSPPNCDGEPGDFLFAYSLLQNGSDLRERPLPSEVGPNGVAGPPSDNAGCTPPGYRLSATAGGR